MLEVFAAVVHAINEAITGAHRRGLSELDMYSDSRFTIPFCAKHSAIAGIKDLIKTNRVEVYMRRVRIHVKRTNKERADTLPKASSTQQFVDVGLRSRAARSRNISFATSCQSGKRGVANRTKVG